MGGGRSERFTMTADTPAPGLWLIGLGPGDLEHMTERAKSVARGCEKRYLEGYTAVLPAEQEALLEGIIGPWEKLMRPSVEKPEKLLEEARGASIALLVVGDPMQATTHIDLEARCAERGVGFDIVPGMSATSLAVSLSGLQSYRFGRQVTLPFSYGDYLATSPLEMIDANYVGGLHSLVLLDLDPTGMGFDPPKPMQPEEAVAMLERMCARLVEEQGERESLETPVRDWDGILLSDIGTERQRVIAGHLSDLSEVEGGWIHTLILPAEMSGNEREAFERRSVG